MPAGFAVLVYGEQNHNCAGKFVLLGFRSVGRFGLMNSFGAVIFS